MGSAGKYGVASQAAHLARNDVAGSAFRFYPERCPLCFENAVTLNPGHCGLGLIGSVVYGVRLRRRRLDGIKGADTGVCDASHVMSQ